MVTLASVLLILAAIAAVYGQSCENADAEVLILGAGMSGISAARTLYDNGVTDFVILEQARDCNCLVSHKSTEFVICMVTSPELIMRAYFLA